MSSFILSCTLFLSFNLSYNLFSKCTFTIVTILIWRRCSCKILGLKCLRGRCWCRHHLLLLSHSLHFYWNHHHLLLTLDHHWLLDHWNHHHLLLTIHHHWLLDHHGLLLGHHWLLSHSWLRCCHHHRLVSLCSIRWPPSDWSGVLTCYCLIDISWCCIH